MTEMNEVSTAVESENSGKIVFADDVIATIAALAAADVEGVAGMSGGVVEGLTERLGMKNITKGVKVEVGTEEAAVDVFVNVRYGFRIQEVCQNLQKAIKSAIENLEASLKDWVNETLTGYSTVAATEAGIAALKDDLEGQLSGQKAYLEGLLTSLSNDMTKNNAELKKLVDANAKAIEANKKAIEESAKKITQQESDLAAAKTEIKTAYEKAISDAVSASEGKLTKEITDRIAEVNKSIDDKVTKVQNAVDALTVKVADLEKSVQAISADLTALKNSVKDLEDRLNARIQSISYIPTYADRVEEVYFTIGDLSYIKDLTIQFEVMPHDMAQKITVDQVSGQATYPQTRAASLTSF